MKAGVAPVCFGGRRGASGVVGDRLATGLALAGVELTARGVCSGAAMDTRLFPPHARCSEAVMDLNSRLPAVTHELVAPHSDTRRVTRHIQLFRFPYACG